MSGDSTATAPPAFQFYAADWLSSTSILLMSAAEERGYLHLLCHAWADENCSLPDDPPKLMKLALLRKASQLEVVLRQFIPHPELPGRLVNGRLFEVRQKTDDFRAERAAAGRVGGRKAQARRLEDVELSQKLSTSTALSSASPELQAHGEQKPSSSSSSSGAPKEHRSSLASLESAHGGEAGPVEGRTPEELPAAVEGLSPEELVAVYNDNARRGGLAFAKEINSPRRARLRVFSRKRPKLAIAEWGAFVEALGREPWACGTKPGGRTSPIGIDTLLRGDFFERQSEMLLGGPRQFQTASTRSSSRPQKWEEFDRLSMTAGDEPLLGARAGEESR